MQIENLSWFPGHMTKTKRMIASEIQHMDAVCEILDARIPLSSRNPDVDDLTAGKPRLIVLNPDIGYKRLVNLVTAWEHEIKEMMGGMGINSIEALRGNRLMLRGVGLNEKELQILGIKHAGE